MIATIGVIAAIAEKKKTSAIIAIIWNHSPAIAATTTVAEIWKVLSQRSLSLQSLESGFHMIARWTFFLSYHSDRSDHMETGLNLSQ